VAEAQNNARILSADGGGTYDQVCGRLRACFSMIVVYEVIAESIKQHLSIVNTM